MQPLIENSLPLSRSCLTLFFYIVFPVFAIVDFALGFLAKEQGWYDRCVGQIVCDWSASACAVWIALALSAFLVAAFAVVNKLVKTLCRCCCCYVPPPPPDEENSVGDPRSRRQSRVSHASHAGTAMGSTWGGSRTAHMDQGRGRDSWSVGLERCSFGF